MAARTGVFAPSRTGPGDVPVFRPVALSAEAPSFAPLGPGGLRLGSPSDAEKQFARCAARLRALRADSSGQPLREELNLLFDQLLSENYNRPLEPNASITPEDVCSLLKHVSSLVPLSQEHLVVKFCQVAHHLLTPLKIIIDEQTLDTLLSYTTRGLRLCGTWTHADILVAIATIVYGNGSRCCKRLGDMLDEDGIILQYSSPSQPTIELRRVALSCLANICLKMPGQPPLDDHYRRAFFNVFLKTLQSPKPSDTDELFYCLVIQAALKGLQFSVSIEKRTFGGEDLGSILATLKRLMFQGTPGVSVEWPAVLHPLTLPQYECLAAPKPAEAPVASEPPKDPPLPGKTSGGKKKKSRGKGKKAGTAECRWDDEEDNDQTPGPALQTGGRGEAESLSKPAALSLYPAWKRADSDTEFSDSEGNAQSKLRLCNGHVRKGALHCLLAFVKGVEKRTLYGFWSSFIPDSPSGGPLTLVTVILKDPMPMVRLYALQVLSAMLDGSRQFLALSEDAASPRSSYTPFSFLLAATVRELHHALSLAMLAETSPQTLTQLIKCLAHLVLNAPYHRLRPGLLTPLWNQISPFVRHRDVNVRVSALTLYGALMTTQAPLPEVQLLLQQPGGSSSRSSAGSLTPQDSALSWRQRDAATASPRAPLAPCQRTSGTHSPCAPRTPAEEDGSLPWLVQQCMSLVMRPREDQSDSEGPGSGGGGGALEPLPVRVEALQVMSHLVRGYFPAIQAHLFEMAHVCIRCLGETDPSIQLHGTKLLEELGTAIIMQYSAEKHMPENMIVPMSQVLAFWSEVLNGPLNRALQDGLHPLLQTSACDALSSILPEAFALLPDKTKLMCITVLLGLAYSENPLLRGTAVRALGVYVLFPCLREDVMFLADTANAILGALDDQIRNTRYKAAWSLANLTDTLIVNVGSVGAGFQEEISDMLLLKMLQAATRGASYRDKVKSNAVRAVGNLLRFLRQSQLARPAFQRPLEDAIDALVKTVLSDATMKVRWNACYALGNAFRNPALPLESAPWSRDVFSSLCHVVTSCTNFKVRIRSAAALAVPDPRSRYGDAEQFSGVWRSLATALDNSEDTNDFLEYRYSASLRHTLCQALLHLLGVSQSQDMPALGTALSGEEGRSIREHLIRYVRAEGRERDGGVGDVADDSVTPQQRVAGLQQTVVGLKGLKAEGEQQAEEERGKEVVVDFLEDLIKTCEEP